MRQAAFEGIGNRLEVFFDTGQRARHIDRRLGGSVRKDVRNQFDRFRAMASCPK